MFQNRNIVSAIEFGSSKICVLVGESDGDGHIDVIGRGEAPSAGVVKGELINIEAAFDQLAVALEEADQSSGRELNNTRIFVVPVTGCGISSCQGVGTVFIKNAGQRVTDAERAEAHQNARIHPLDTDRLVLNSSESYFVIDDRLRLRNPIGQTAHKLDAHVHIVHALSNRLENYRSVVRESGYEDNVEMVFSPLASGVGILSAEEREGGVLLVDFGAGVTEYVMEFNNGTIASGMLQVGFDHVLNDLSVGLELPIESCRKLVEEGTLAQLMREKRDYVDFPSATGKVRRIPLASFEIIADQRLRETFEIIRRKINNPAEFARINCGGVLTGGGALFERSGRIFREVFDLSVRVGHPLDIGGAVTGLENPRYSAVWGALKIADYYQNLQNDASGGIFQRFSSSVGEMADKLRRSFGGIRGSFRV